MVYGTNGRRLRHIENLQYYLKAAAAFGIQSSDLFDVADLFEEKNVNMVLTHINALAKYAAYVHCRVCVRVALRLRCESDLLTWRSCADAELDRLAEAQPGYAGPKIGDTSKAQNMLGSALLNKAVLLIYFSAKTPRALTHTRRARRWRSMRARTSS